MPRTACQLWALCQMWAHKPILHEATITPLRVWFISIIPNSYFQQIGDNFGQLNFSFYFNVVTRRHLAALSLRGNPFCFCRLSIMLLYGAKCGPSTPLSALHIYLSRCTLIHTHTHTLSIYLFLSPSSAHHPAVCACERKAKQKAYRGSVAVIPSHLPPLCDKTVCIIRKSVLHSQVKDTKQGYTSKREGESGINKGICIRLGRGYGLFSLKTHSIFSLLTAAAFFFSYI